MGRELVNIIILHLYDIDKFGHIEKNLKIYVYKNENFVLL